VLQVLKFTFLTRNIYSALTSHHYKYFCIGRAHLDNNVFCIKVSGLLPGVMLAIKRTFQE
jgi:hypothetical protein